MDSTTLLGLIAGTLTTLSFLPQLFKVWRSKSAKDFSLAWLVIFTSGVFLWLVYGLLSGGLPVILANGITLVLTLMIMVVKLKYR